MNTNGNVIEEKIGQQKINWKDFETQYVKLDEGEPKVLQLTSWQPITKTYDGTTRKGISFKVLNINGCPSMDKTFETTSKRLILKLKPLIEYAEEQPVKVITVAITRLGIGKATTYNVRNVRSE